MQRFHFRTARETLHVYWGTPSLMSFKSEPNCKGNLELKEQTKHSAVTGAINISKHEHIYKGNLGNTHAFESVTTLS